MGFEPMNP